VGEGGRGREGGVGEVSQVTLLITDGEPLNGIKVLDLPSRYNREDCLPLRYPRTPDSDLANGESRKMGNAASSELEMTRNSTHLCR
jgi:hypothetical protein